MAELAQHAGGVLGGGDLREDRIGDDLVGGEVAQVLVDPVRGEPAADPLRPPRLLAHLRAPRRRGVPVVDDLVIVEDHHARHGGEQPADLRITPGLQVELGVLVEAHHLVGRSALRPPPPSTQQPAHGRRGDVGVDLVAEQHQQVGQRVRLRVGHQPPGVRVQRVRWQLAGGGVLGGLPARAEDQIDRLVPIVGGPGADHARREPAARHRPDHLVVDQHLVGGLAVRSEPLHHHERVVVVVRREGGRGAGGAAGGADGDHGGRRRLHPDRRPGVHHSPQQWADEEVCGRHAAEPTAGSRPEAGRGGGDSGHRSGCGGWDAAAGI